MASPVFKNMFFGQLKEQREVFEIEDLTSVGFMNALRYIYGFEIDYELADLYESYMAADKYLLHRFDRAFFEYIRGKLDAKSGCLIYDLLIKIGEREQIPLASVRAQIIENNKEVIESDHFTQIDQETLVSLLSLEQLEIGEFDLLIAVLKWVACEVQRQGLPANAESRRRVFEPIKAYILFTALAPEKVASCDEIVELFTFEERGSTISLPLHQFDAKNLPLITSKTARRAYDLRSVFVDHTDYQSEMEYSEATSLVVSRRVSIRTIYTTYSARAKHLRLKLLDADDEDLGLGLRIENFVKDGRLCFSIKPPFVLEPNRSYTLFVTGDGQLTTEDHMSEQSQLNYDESLTFYFTDFLGSNHIYHCIRGFDFYF